MRIRRGLLKCVQQLRPNDFVGIALAIDEEHGIRASPTAEQKQNFIEIRQPAALLVALPIFWIAFKENGRAGLDFLYPKWSAADNFLWWRPEIVSGHKTPLSGEILQNVLRQNPNRAEKLQKWRKNLRRNNSHGVVIYPGDFEIFVVYPEDIVSALVDLRIVHDLIPGEEDIVRIERFAIAPIDAAPQFER